MRIRKQLRKVIKVNKIALNIVSKFKKPLSLHEIKKDKKLDGILVAKRGQRLSIMPVKKEHFDYILALSK